MLRCRCGYEMPTGQIASETDQRCPNCQQLLVQTSEPSGQPNSPKEPELAIWISIGTVIISVVLLYLVFEVAWEPVKNALKGYPLLKLFLALLLLKLATNHARR
jgi:Ca2+/H+ antiporter